MEGNAATGATVSPYHTATAGNGAIELRDPDLGTAITGFAQFTRDITTTTLEEWVTNVQNNLCLKCHDSNGANAGIVVPSGSALRPFGTAPTHTPGNNVLNVNAHFNAGNASIHPIKAAQNNPYSDLSTMVIPWNQVRKPRTATRAPSAAAGTNWTTPTNVYLSDTLYAIYNNSLQNTVAATGFLFPITTLPDGLTVTGITVTIVGNGTSATLAQRQIRVMMLKAGVAVGTEKTAITLNQTTDTDVVLGGISDLWGAAWLTGDARSTTFGVRIRDNDTTAAALNINQIRVIVHVNTGSTAGNLISCWDCHNTPAPTLATGSVTAHGAANAMRGSKGTYPTATTAPLGSTSTLCLLCHLKTGSGSGSSGAVPNTPPATSRVTATTPGTHNTNMDYACNVCHGSSWLNPGRPTLAEDSHGFNTFTAAGGGAAAWGNWGKDATQSGSRPYSFLRNNAFKSGTGTGAKWASWRMRYDGATDNSARGWGCSWTAEGTVNVAPCSRASHRIEWSSYDPGGKY